MAAPTVGRTRAGDAQRADATPTLHLVVMGPDYSATHQLPASGTLTIGRAEDAQVRIADPLASRYHARLYVS
jgi:pSer/pThr/pTyr-binding forkhead associated (FHA) protein